MKLIYLDIDGVMNSPFDKEQESDMSVDKLKLLSEFMSEEDIDGIVITSDRRYSPFDLKDKTQTFEKYGITVVDTIRPADGTDEDNRGKQIYNHYLQNKDFIDWFVIIDDNNDRIEEVFKEHFVFIGDRYGFSLDTIEIINKRKGELANGVN